MEEEEYYLAVDSKDPNVVAFAPVVGSVDPRSVDIFFKNLFVKKMLFGYTDADQWYPLIQGELTSF